MNFRCLFVIVLCFALFPVWGQVLSGYVRDKEGTPVEFANITLKRTQDSTFEAGALSDTMGYYLFEKIKPGNYIVEVFQVGFVKHRENRFTIIEGAKPSQLDVQLEPDHVQLNEVLIQVQKPVVVQEPGKMTINVENTLSATGLMAIDLLKRMPGVQVDNNGNISLKGKSEVQFMIDGKPSYLSARQIAVILKSLPSNQIANIEIITSPSAKYDARGNAGIININLKKSDKKGVNGTIQAMYGHGFLHKSNLGGSLSAGFKMIQLNALYDYTNNRNLEVFHQERNFGGAASGSRYIQDQRYEVPNETHSYRVSMDYRPTDKWALSLGHRGMFQKDRWMSNNTGTVYSREGTIVQQIISYDNNPNYNSDLGLSASAKYKLDTTGQEISIDGEVSQYRQRSRQNIFTNIANHDTLSSLHFQANLPMNNTIVWGKLDYTWPLTKAIKVETGLKVNHVAIDNLVEYDVTQTGNFLPKIPSDNNFNYSEQVNAGYFSIKMDSTKWGIQIGARVEHWRAEGKLATATFLRDSIQLFPNFLARYKVHRDHEFSFALSRRIDRPNYMTLNPIAYYSDPYTYYVGNPRIQPQSTYHSEVSHNFKGGTIITTLNYSRTTNFISDFAVYQTSDTSKIQFMGPVNIPSFTNVGVSVSFQYPITKWWSSQLFVNLYHNTYAGQTNRYDVTSSIYSFSGNTTQQFTLPRSWSVELTGNYTSAAVYGYLRNKPMGMVSIGIKKDLWSGRVVAKLNFQDLFYTFKYRVETNVPEMNNQFSFRWDNRVVNFSLVWKLEKSALLLKNKE